MRAALYDRYGGPEVLYVGEAPMPQPGPGQVRIKVVASSVNPIDWKVRSGLVPTVKTFPAGTGTDAAGLVDAVGEGVDAAWLGRPVFGATVERRGAAEYCLLHHWAAKPAELSWDEAAALPLAVETALRALRTSQAGPGDVVLIDGAGGSVGTATAQLGRQFGLHLVGTASARSSAMLQELGVTPVPYDRPLRVALGEAGIDHIDRALDYSGRRIPELIELVGDADKVTGIVDHKLGPQLGIRDTASSPTQGAYDALEQAAEMAGQGGFYVALGPIFDLDHIADAQTANQAGAPGKVIVRISQD